MLNTDTKLWTKWVATGAMTQIDNLPKRFLPPGNVSLLHANYLADCEHRKEGCSGYHTFHKSWRKIKPLIFREACEPQDCHECATLRAAFTNAKTMQEQMEALKKQQEHYANVFTSRDLEELLRCNSPFVGPEADASATIFMDGMDQSHWAVPRLEGSFRAPKRFAGLRRPKCKLQGVCFFLLGGCSYVPGRRDTPT